LLYLPVEILFGGLIPLAIANGLEPADWTYTLLVLYAVGLVRTANSMIVLGRMFGPAGRWLASAPPVPDPRDLRDVDSVLRRGAVGASAWISAGWAITLIAGMLILLYVDRYTAGIAPRSLLTGVLMAVAVGMGAMPLIIPIISLALHDAARTVFHMAHKARIPLNRPPSSLKLKLVLLTASIGLAGPLWMASTSYSSDAARTAVEARAQCEVAAYELAYQANALSPGDTAGMTKLAAAASQHGLVAAISTPSNNLAADPKLPPPIKAWLASPVPPAGRDYKSNARDSEVAARALAPNGAIAVVTTSVGNWASSATIWTLIAFFAVIVAWAPACAYLLAIEVVRPLADITRAVQQITEVGKLDEVSSIMVTTNDEPGILGARFNDLIETMRDLSSAAGAIAMGDLEIRLEGEGDVATAFRSMIESLGRIVRQIHETSILLAAAATEIYAASQEQEAAAASQSTAMVEIRQTMESLFEAAAHVSESVRGVLSNAERTLETTDRMVVRIGDLTNHAGRIGEILETIRDISDRSDLLALNGALEASRAGEAGRGFGLVAAEMRRLAERVMSSVHDVRSLVGDIRASGSSTMIATEDSKKLAASTTDAARQITLVTQQQRSGTEQVLQSVREIAETLTQSVAAMAQTRSSAEQLKSQADKLSSLVRAFRIETTQA
jgi:methyl-accepting chemotaxis protein